MQYLLKIVGNKMSKIHTNIAKQIKIIRVFHGFQFEKYSQLEEHLNI